MSIATPPPSRIPWYNLTARQRTDHIHNRFVTEGTFVAFPLSLPGASLPITHDESAITALACTADGTLYGGTSGHACHLFVALLHGSGGGVLDLGTVAEGDHCAAVVVGSGRVAACVNGPRGGRLLIRDELEMSSDLIQEWLFTVESLRDLGAPVPGERILHAVGDGSGRWLIGITESQLFRLDLATEAVELLAPLRSAASLAADQQGQVFGLEPAEGDQPAALWRCHVATGKLERRAIALPPGAWENCQPVWTIHPRTGTLYLTDAAGWIYPLTNGRVEAPLAQATPTPILTMAATADGRIFGMCGDGICRLFTLDLSSGELKDLACVASVLQAKRYGYVFGSALLGRDGQIVFGETDNGAHLWLYFPRVKGHPQQTPKEVKEPDHVG